MMGNIEELYKNNSEFRESRLKSLFSDYHNLKEHNPEGYEANLNIWKHFLSQVFQSNDSLTFNYELLSKELCYKTSKASYKPEGLYIALNEMLNSDKNIISLSAVQSTYKEEDENSSLFSKISSILFGSTYIDIRNKKYRNESFIFVPKIEEYSQILKKYLIPIIKEGPMNLKHLQSILHNNEFNINNDDLMYSLLYLNKSMKQFTVVDGIIYWFNEKLMEEKVNTDDLKHITDLNYAIYKLQLYNDEKSTEITNLNIQIRKSLKDKNQITAKSQLKLKKMLEFQLQKTLTSLENLHAIKIKVEDAQNNILVSKVWKDNSKVLKILNEKVKDSNFDDIFDSLYEEIQTTNQISDHLGQQIDGDDVSDEEINKELCKLEDDFEKEKNNNSNDNDMDIEDLEKKFDKLKIPNKKPEKKRIKDDNGGYEEERIAVTN